MKKVLLIVAILIIIIVLFFVVKINFGLENNKYRNYNEENREKDDDELKEGNYSMNVIINEKSYEVILYDNETVDSLLELLPLELNMSELNGNEKYYYLNSTLPSNSKNPGKIEKGDIMLYGNDCLVVFYKSFNTSYSYTKIGHIDNLPDLGNGSIKIEFIK